MIPRITEASQVAEVVQMMKYPPIGRRGSVMARAHTNFRPGNVEQAMEQMNKETMLVVQIETAEALASREEIIGVPGVDAALIGPNDLSIAMGIPGKLEDPAFVSAVQSVIATCVGAGVVPALHINELEKAAFWASKGMRMVSVSSEAAHLGKSGREVVAAVSKAFRPEPARPNVSEITPTMKQKLLMIPDRSSSRLVRADVATHNQPRRVSLRFSGRPLSACGRCSASSGQPFVVAGSDSGDGQACQTR
jgi:hypothetical protein